MARLEDVHQRRRRSVAAHLPWCVQELLTVVNASPTQDPDAERTRRWWRAELASHIAGAVWCEFHHSIQIDHAIPESRQDWGVHFLHWLETQRDVKNRCEVLRETGQADEAQRIFQAESPKGFRGQKELNAGGSWREPVRSEIKAHFDAALGMDDALADREWVARAVTRFGRDTQHACINSRIEDWQAAGKQKRWLVPLDGSVTVYVPDDSGGVFDDREPECSLDPSIQREAAYYMPRAGICNIDVYEMGLTALYREGLLLDVRVCPACSHFFVRTHDRMRCCSAKCRQKMRPVVKRDRAAYVRRHRVEKKEQGKRRRINDLNLRIIPALEKQIKKLDAQPYVTPSDKKALRAAREALADRRDELTTSRKQLQAMCDRSASRVTTRKTSR